MRDNPDRGKPLQVLKDDSPRIFDVPLPLHPMVGRRDLLAEVCATILQPDVRMVTLTGPGGIGKSRLAIDVVCTLSDSYQRIHAISLASVVDPALILATIARTLGVTDEAGVAWSDRIKGVTGGKPTLLLLDNLEQITNAGAPITALIESAHEIDVIATSRIPLDIPGEHEIVLPCLDLPDRETPLADLSSIEAIALFVARVRRFDADFVLTERSAPLIVDICTVLDGLPLAIELAAARVKMLSLSALRSRLNDHIDILAGGPHNHLAHQRTMRDTIDWSYRLLNADEQWMLRALAVFSTTFPLSAVWKIVGDREDLTEERATTLVHSLINKSLLRQSESNGEGTRFLMLMTIRSFAREEARRQGEEARLRNAHARWCLHLIEELWPIPNATFIPADILRRIDRRFPDIQRALVWLEECGNAEMLLLMTTHLSTYWTLRSFRMEGRSWLARALSLPTATHVSESVLAAALMAAAGVARTQNDLTQAERWAVQSLAIYQKLGDRLRKAAALNLIAVLARAQNQLGRAEDLCQKALAIFTTLNEPTWIALVECNLATIALWQGHTREARTHIEAAVRTYRSTANDWGLTFSLLPLALIRCAQGDSRTAAHVAMESLQLASRVETKECQIDALAAAAVIAVAVGEFESTSRMLGSVETMSQTISYVLERPEYDHYERARIAAHQALGEERFQRAWQEGKELTWSSAIDEGGSFLLRVSGNSRTRMPIPVAQHGKFTPREHQVLALMRQRLTDKEIAETLEISPRTVSRHVSNIFDKLDVRSRREVAQILGDTPA